MSDDAMPTSEAIRGKAVAFVGKLASMSKREAVQWARRHGATVVEKPDAKADWIVVGEGELPGLAGDELDAWLEGPDRSAAAVMTETQFWEAVGVVELHQDIHRLYTPAMLAELVGVPLAVIRRWHRRGLIVPTREVRRLPYFDFQEVATARRLAELLAAGVSPHALERKLGRLAKVLPGVERPLAQLSVIVRGKEILLRQGDGLIEPGGQLRFDFEAAETEGEPAPTPVEIETPAVLSMRRPGIPEAPPPTPEQMCEAAADLEEQGRLDEAIEMYRAAMAAEGPGAETCFHLAELLYRTGDLPGARERYYMAIELDEDYVEARANLGCVLAQTGQRELAIAAFEGALRYHPDYADVHYHFARTLDEMGRPEAAAEHWRMFLELAFDSPWADEARARLGETEE